VQRILIPIAVALATFVAIAATDLARVEGTLTEQAKTLANRLEHTMTTVTKYKYDADGNLVLSMTWTQQPGETLDEFLTRVEKEWAAACARLGGGS